MKVLYKPEIVCDGDHSYVWNIVSRQDIELDELRKIHKKLWKEYEHLKYDEIYFEAFNDGFNACLRNSIKQ